MPLPLSFPTGLQPPSAFPNAIESFGAQPLVVCHNDADGLSAGAILLQALRRTGREPGMRIVGKAENVYSDAFRREMAEVSADGMVIQRCLHNEFYMFKLSTVPI